MPPRQCTKTKHKIANGTRRICLPIDRENYGEPVKDKREFRAMIDSYLERYPELFPAEMVQGYQLYGFRQPSKKMPDVQLRRICLHKSDADGRLQVYAITPGFVLPYMMGDADDVEKAFFLRRFGVPFWALTYVFGRDDMYWQRLKAHFGSNDDDCVLGASIVLSADEEQLTSAYEQFKEESQHLDPDYQPQTLNTDGWSATQLAWKTLFPTIVIIQCFLHAFITIRSRCKRLKDFFPSITQQVWDIYHAETVDHFNQQVDDLRTRAQQHLKSFALKSVLKLCDKSHLFTLTFQYPDAYRTSNMLDRHMEPMDRYLYSTRYFHGHLMSTEYQIRAWALFHPYCPRSNISDKYQSPFHKLNGFVYHENWLQNLLVASSLGGRYATNTKQ